MVLTIKHQFHYTCYFLQESSWPQRFIPEVLQTASFFQVHSTCILIPRGCCSLGQHQELGSLAIPVFWACAKTLEVCDSQTSHQIWQIWLAKSKKQLLRPCSENQVWPEVAILSADQKDKMSMASGDRKDSTCSLHLQLLQQHVRLRTTKNIIHTT